MNRINLQKEVEENNKRNGTVFQYRAVSLPVLLNIKRSHFNHENPFPSPKAIP